MDSKRKSLGCFIRNFIATFVGLSVAYLIVSILLEGFICFAFMSMLLCGVTPLHNLPVKLFLVADAIVSFIVSALTA